MNLVLRQATCLQVAWLLLYIYTPSAHTAQCDTILTLAPITLSHADTHVQWLVVNALLHAVCQVWVQGILQPQAEASGPEQQSCGGHTVAGRHHSWNQPRRGRHQVSMLHRICHHSLFFCLA